MRKPGVGTRFDKMTGNAIDIARESAPGVGVRLRYDRIFCAKCQQDKSTKGGKRRAGMFFCADCCAPNVKASP